MAETLKANSSGLNGETDPLKIDSPEKKLKSQNEDKTSKDNIENGDVYISSKEISEKDNSDCKSDKKSICDSTPKKAKDAKAVDDKNSNSESIDKDKLEGGSRSEQKDSTLKTSNSINTSEPSECEEDDQKDETVEKDVTTKKSEEKDNEKAEEKEDATGNVEEKDDTTEKKKEKDDTTENVEEKDNTTEDGEEKDEITNVEEKDDTTENVKEKDNSTENVEDKDATENIKDISAVEDEKDNTDKKDEQQSKESEKEDKSEKDKIDAKNEKIDQMVSTKLDSKTLFSESESSDNEDSNGKWEAKNIIMYNEDEEKYYTDKKKEIQKEVNKSLTCTACSKQIYNTNRSEVFTHPVLGVTICKKCTRFYGKGDFNKDEDGMDEYCRWCANGGELLLCDKCTNGFCKACVRRNLGRGALKEILSQDEWSCYVCSFEPIMNIRALHRAVVENIREKGPDSKSQSKKKETTAKESPRTIVSRKKARSPGNNVSHNEDIKGLLFLFQKELQKIEKRQNSKEKVSDLKFHRRLVRLIDLMQENFKRVKNEIEEGIKDFDEKEGSNSEESEGLQEKINKLSEKVKSGSKKRGYEQITDEEDIEEIPQKKRKVDGNEDSVKITKSSAKKKRTPAKRSVSKPSYKDVEEKASESDNDEVEKKSQKMAENPKRLRVRSDLFSASNEKEKSKDKNIKGAARKLKGNHEDSDMESLPSITETKSDGFEDKTAKRRSGRKAQTPKASKKADDSDDDEENTPKRRSGRKAQTPKASKSSDDSDDNEEDTPKRKSERKVQTTKASKNKITPSVKGTKPTPQSSRSRKKSEDSFIDLCSDSETESHAKNRKGLKRKAETPVKQSRNRRK